eukprot:2444820-Rhodomonas_salina.1
MIAAVPVKRHCASDGAGSEGGAKGGMEGGEGEGSEKEEAWRDSGSEKASGRLPEGGGRLSSWTGRRRGSGRAGVGASRAELCYYSLAPPLLSMAVTLFWRRCTRASREGSEACRGRRRRRREQRGGLPAVCWQSYT